MICSITAKKLCTKDNCEICFNRSFASNEKSKFLNDKNINPKILLKCSNKKYNFNCNKCEHVFECSLNNINNNRWCPYCSDNKLCEEETCEICFEKSFASHNMSTYWNYEKNNIINPRNIFKNSHKLYYFNCDKCNHIFMQQLDVINKGIGCPFCCSPPKQLCQDNNCSICFKKSFASHKKALFWNIEKNNGLKAREVFKSSNKKYWFNCDVCTHNFNIQINNISSGGQWCNYCANKNLCNNNNCKLCYDKSFSSHYRAKFWNYDKNNISPRNIFKNSHDKFWFNCDKCNNCFDMRLDNINNLNQFCPYCKNKTELMMYEYLLELNIKVKKEVKFKWCKNKKTGYSLPYDFVLEEYKIIIEIDGLQHFENIIHWKTNFEEIQERDKYKMKFANTNGYSVIRILQEDIYFEKYDWKKEILDNIKKYDNPKIIYICKNNEYDCYN